MLSYELSQLRDKEVVVQSRLNEIVALREQELGRRIEQKEIIQSTGLDKNTVSRWMSPEPMKRIEGKAWLMLATWAECDPRELIIFEVRNESS